MTTFAVIDKASSQEVYRYNADSPIEWAGFEFATHEHVEALEASHPAPARSVFEWRPVDFMRRFTPAERIAIRAQAKIDPVVEDLMALMNSAPIIRSDDADVQQGLRYLTQAGVLDAGRATEVLEGA